MCGGTHRWPQCAKRTNISSSAFFPVKRDPSKGKLSLCAFSKLGLIHQGPQKARNQKKTFAPQTYFCIYFKRNVNYSFIFFLIVRNFHWHLQQWEIIHWGICGYFATSSTHNPLVVFFPLKAEIHPIAFAPYSKLTNNKRDCLCENVTKPLGKETGSSGICVTVGWSKTGMNGKSDSHHLAWVPTVTRPRSTLLPPPSAGNCCSAGSRDIVGTKEAKQKGLSINIYILFGHNELPVVLGVGIRSRKLAMLQISTIYNLLSEPFRCTSFKQRRRYSAEPANPSVSFDVTRMIIFFSPPAFIGTFPVQVLPDQMLLRSKPARKSNANNSHRFLVKITTWPICVQSQNRHSQGRKSTLNR